MRKTKRISFFKINIVLKMYLSYSLILFKKKIWRVKVKFEQIKESEKS